MPPKVSKRIVVKQVALEPALLGGTPLVLTSCAPWPPINLWLPHPSSVNVMSGL